MPSHLATSDPDEPSAPGVRYDGIREGTVFSNEDPRGLGRIRANIPGLFDQGSAWAFPVAMGGGSPQDGHFLVPKTGASVYVFFLDGDPDKPRYFTGHYGQPDGDSESPTDAKVALDTDGPAGPPQIRTWETDDFVMTFDSRDDKTRFILYTKSKGQSIETGASLLIELDNEQGICSVTSPVAIILKSAGWIDIDGALGVNIFGRKVQRINRPI